MKQENKDTAGSSGDDYDPHLHREIEHPTSNVETLIHLLKGCLGTGILAMPEAFKRSGTLNGVVSTIVIGLLCTYCLHVLIKAQYILCKRLHIPLLSYPESMKLALQSGPKCLQKFANASPYIVDFFLVAYQVGICCVYVVFVSVNIKAVCDQYISDYDIKFYILATFLPFILILCIRNLKLLAPFSTVANILTLVSFGAVCYYIFQDLPHITDRPAYGTLYAYPLFVGTTLFALEAVGVIIVLEGNMKTPKSFTGVFGILSIGMFIVVFLYFGLGLIGFWKYGEDANATLTLNFPPKEILAQTIRLLYSLAIYISYGLQGFVPVSIMWETYIVKHLEGSNHLVAWEYLVRFLTVILTFILAISIPMLGLYISLFGSFCLSALGFAFPAIIEICVKWPDDLGKGNWIVVKNILFIIFGFVALLTGCYSCISEMIVAFTTKKA